MSTAKKRQIIQRYNKERQRNILAKPGPNEFILVLDSLKPSFNVAKIFRSAEAFGATAIHLIDIGTFDTSPAKGSFRKVPAVFHESFSDSYRDLTDQGYHLYNLSPDSKHSLTDIELPAKSAFVFGHEEFGHSFSSKDFPEIQPVSIPQFGSVQSLNVSIAASIVMFEYIRQNPP